MALEKATVSVNLGQTIDQKDGEFVGDPGSFMILKDWVRNKFKQLDKRPGTETFKTDVITDFPNPLSIGTTDIPPSVFAHRDQLLLQNKGVLYSWNDDREAWSFKSHYYPLKARASTAIAKSEDVFGANTGYFNGIKYTLYQQGTGLMLRVEDISTGNVIRPDVMVDQNLSPGFDVIGTPQVLVFSSAVVLAWQYQVNSPLSASIKVCPINTVNGTIGSVSTVTATAGAVFYPSPDPTGAGVGFQAAVCDKAGVGERAFIVFYSTSFELSVIALTSAGVVDGAIGTFTGSGLIDRGFGIYYSENNRKLYIGYQTTTPRVLILDFSSSGYTQVFEGAISAPTNEERYRNFAFCDDPRSSTSVYYLTDSCVPVPYSNGTGYADVIYAQKLTPTGLDGSSYEFSHGMSLCAKLIKDTERETIYVPAQQQSNLQSTILILDLLKGKTDGSAFVQVKLNYGDHEATYPTMLPDVWLHDRLIEFATTKKVRLTGERLIGSGSPENLPEQATFQVGISKNEINLAPEFSLRSEYLAGSQMLPGGYLGMFDGAEFCEHNFFIQPEYISASSPPTADYIGINIVQQGTESLPEITDFTVLSGALYSLMTPSAASYVENFTLGGAANRWNFSVNGSGIPPTGGAYNNSIPILNTDTPEQVARKCVSYLSANVSGYLFSYRGGSTFRITNIGAGASTDAHAVNFTVNMSGPAPGDHGVGVIWSWVDNNGFQHRSAPVTATVKGAGFPISVMAYCPSISNRSISSLRSEVYITEASQTTLHRVLFAGEGEWNESTCGVSFVIAGVSDETIKSGENLYTTGGILSNNSIGACSAVSVFKNRLVITGMDNSSVQYSKTVQIGLPVEIAEELYIQTSATDDPVEGAVQMDDKLVVFKGQSIVSYAGDGANDAGQNVSFSQPIDVATDCGCTNANSIALAPEGLYFRSKLGIQLIDRSLSVRYPGIQVKDYNNRHVGKALLLKDDEKVRELRFILNSGEESICYDYLAQQWVTFTHYEGTDACLWDGQFVRCDIDGLVYVERRGTWIDTFPDPDDNVSYSPTLTTQWLKVSGEQDYQRIWRMMILGKLRSPHQLQFKVYYDYDDTAFDSYSFDSINISGGTGQDASVYQPEIHLKRQKCDAIKVEMSVVPNELNPGTEEGLILTDMSFLAGRKRGLNKVSAAKKL